MAKEDSRDSRKRIHRPSSLRAVDQFIAKNDLDAPRGASETEQLSELHLWLHKSGLLLGMPQDAAHIAEAINRESQQPREHQITEETIAV